MKPAKANVCILVTNLRCDVWEFVSKRFSAAMTKGTCSSLLGGKMWEKMSKESKGGPHALLGSNLLSP